VLEHVRSTKGKWQLVPYSPECPISIRHDDGCCPLESAGGVTPGHAGAAARTLGLSTEEWRDIVYAADDFAPYPLTLRAALLEAAGLTERRA
jgi:hypothetical protein